MKLVSGRVCVAILLPLFAACGGGGGGGGGGGSPTQRSLSLNISGAGGRVVSTPAGIDCSSGAVGTCSADFDNGTTVTLTASTTTGGVEFKGWGVACAPLDQPTCTLTMNANRVEVGIFGSTAVGGVGDTFAISAANELVTFDLADATTPKQQRSKSTVSGLGTQKLVAIDFRPANRQLYGVAVNVDTGAAKLYMIDTISAQSTFVADISAAIAGTAASRVQVGMDFDATTDTLYLTTQDKVLAVNPANGSATEAALAPANTAIRSLAFTNAFAGAQRSQAYAVGGSKLYKVGLDGVLTIVNDLSPATAVDAENGFDIHGATGLAYLLFNDAGKPYLQTLNLVTGARGTAAEIGSVPLRGFALTPSKEPQVFAICNEEAATSPTPPTGNPNACVTGKTLVRFDATDPAEYVVVGDMPLDGATALSIDTNPVTNQLTVLASNGKLYTVNPSNATTGTGVALAGAGYTFNPDALYDIEFNVAGGYLRVVNSADENLRVNPATGAVTVDGAIKRTPFEIGSVAYSNNVNTGSPAASSTLYAIDTLKDYLYTLSGSNGRLTRVGAGLGVDAQAGGSFDIASTYTPPSTFNSNVAYAVWNVSNVPTLYEINLTSGTAAIKGTLAGGSPIAGMTVTINDTTPELYIVTKGASPTLYVVNPATPGTATSTRSITGLETGEEILALDFRPGTTPLNSSLYALGSSGNLYTIDLGLISPGQVTSVGSLQTVGPPPAAYELPAGRSYGMDFNPTSNNASSIKLVDSSGRNATIDISTPGAATVSSNTALIRYPDLVVTTAAQTNNAPGATSSELMVMTANGITNSTTGLPDLFLKVNPVNDGHAEEMDADLDVDADTDTKSGYDIAGGHDGLALLGIQIFGDVAVDSFTTLYEVDLASGAGNPGDPARTIGAASTPEKPADTRIGVIDLTIRFPD